MRNCQLIKKYSYVAKNISILYGFAFSSLLPFFKPQLLLFQDFVEKIRKALYASKIISYAQGFMLLREAGASYDWKLNFGGIALMWRGGCIIRSAFLGKIKEAFDKGKFAKVINFRQRIALVF